MKREKDSCISATCASRSRAGYSLIEMAIAILIIGLLFAPAADVYSTYTEYQKRDTTRTNITDIISALDSYREANGSFPCPSGLSVPRTDPAYGTAFDCTSGGPLAVAPAAGTCDTGVGKGICIEQTKRADATSAGWSAYQKRVIVGGIPFRQMQVPENKTYDGYGNRLVYVLTQSMADITKLSTLNGGISIEDPSGKSLINPKDSAVFAVISPGKDGVGGWTFDGAEHLPCNGAVGADVANCNPGFEGKTPTLNAVVVDAYASTAVGATHYDDVVNYFQSKPDPLWRYIAGTTNIVDLTDKSVGVGDTPPTAPPQPIELHVSKAAAAPKLWDVTLTPPAATIDNTDALLVYGIDANGNAGKIQADSICDANGANCFDPAIIGGTTASPGNFQPGNAGMGCPTGKVMAGIDLTNPTNVANYGGADCRPVAMTCSPDPITGETRYITAVVGGVPTCAVLKINCQAATEPAPSPAADGTTCNTIPVLADLDGNSQNFAAPGWDANGCRSVTYTCTKGVWNKTSDNGGFCQLAAATHPPCDCTVIHNLNFTGTCVYTTAEDCTGAYSTTVTTDSCVCKANTIETQACPSPWTGGTEKRTTTYSGKNCNGSTGNWNTSQCDCSLPKTTTTSGTCPTGYNTGSTTITGTLDKNTCTYSYSTSLAGCGCAAPNPSTRDIAVSCPPPAAGAGTQHQVFNSTLGVCAWQDSGGITGCTCPANTSQTQACPSPWASGNETRTVTYGAAPACNITYGTWNTSGCACPTNYTESQACPSPANGNETRTHSFGAGPTCTETISGWDTSACSCPANATQVAACVSPYTGGTQSRAITYGAPPTCTQTVGSWDTSLCTCSKSATITQTLGCGTGYNQGSITQTATLDNPTCSYGPWVTTGNSCACVTPTPATQTVSCGSCTSPWSGTQSCDEPFVNNPGVTCDWGSPGTPYGCTCDTTTHTYSRLHDCTGMGLDCYYANPNDPDTYSITNIAGSGTCTVGPEVPIHTGTCSSLGFTLQDPQTDGSTTPSKGSNPRYYLTGGCTCAEHRAWVLDNNSTVTCYSPSSGDMKIYNCSCR